MKITYWSDYACPYCYIAEARLHNAMQELGVETDVELEPRAFELDPTAPKTVVSDTKTRFAAKYRLSPEEAQAQIDHISRLGNAEGIDFRYAQTQYTNTFDAHRLMKLGLHKGTPEQAQKLNDLLFAAYFTRNLKLAEKATLLEAGLAAGLAESDIHEVLDSDLYSDEVRADEAAAARRGVRGVPYFVFNDSFTVPGAISTADFKDALRAALASEKSVQKGEQCGPDGCRIDFS